ncbi:MAG TPA: ATP-binding protein, partial [Kofleriaceae bacterium]|nr:ATP-binding protein [Kofleriaceae bacterium]
MTRQVAPLDAAEITGWLTRVTQAIDRSLREPARAEALRALRDEHAGTGKLGLPVLTQLALLADCLRVAHLAIGDAGQADPDALARVAELVRVATSKYFLALPRYEVFDDDAASRADVVRFLRHHRDDDGPFGLARPDAWPGLALVRLVERATRDAGPLREHEHMLGRILEEVLGARATDAARAARRRLRDLLEPPAAPAEDPRALAFCRSDGPEVFSSIAHGAHVHEPDPFDIEAIHAAARDVFSRRVDRATTPEHARRGDGCTLLVLGDSGAGKTHLLRALRAQVHGRRQGYVGYMQMTADVDDPPRHVLRSLVDSLERAYDPPVLAESGLMYLSDGLAEARGALPPDALERLRSAELGPEELEDLIGALVDRIVRIEGLEGLEIDLVQALLLLQRRDPALQRRVVRFLRCEPLTGYDRRLLGGLQARDRPEDALRTIQQLATLMHELQLAALVLMIDQVEELVPDGKTLTRLQRALDGLRAISDAVPSAVVVIACLDDVYRTVRPGLSRSLVDRLERDPPLRLASERQPDEIEQMLRRRLEHLYAAFDVAWREDDPLFPFTPAQIEAVSQLRTRDCLGKFREYHNACIAARAVVPPTPAPAPEAPRPAAGAPAPPVTLDRLWNETLGQVGAMPDDDDQLLELVADALRGAAIELDLALAIERDAARRLVVGGPQLRRRLLALCNRAPQGGRLGVQIDELRATATSAGL